MTKPVTSTLSYLTGAACLVEIEGQRVRTVVGDEVVSFEDSTCRYVPTTQMITIGTEHPGVGYMQASVNGEPPKYYHIMFWTMVPLTDDQL